VPRLSHTAVLLLALTASTGGTANAEEKNSKRFRGAFGVALQPFAAEAMATRRAEAIHVAYLAPRAQAVSPVRAEPADNASSDDEAGAPRMDARGPVVAGNRAILRNGVAYAPSRAPANVQNAIWAVNTLRRKPYRWGGGHSSFYDYGYDCSGTVSFALHSAGLLPAPMPSSDFLRYGERGRGRWITIYSRRGHTFAVIAGLRLDTTDLRYGEDVGPRWHWDGRDTSGFEARHPAGW
jgi:hypothetical protein